MNKVEIIVIDDNLMQDATLIVELGIVYDAKHIKLFNNSNKGLEHISKNLQNKMIIILDINFPSDEYNGHKVLSEIRNLNKLIPVIIWSAKDGSDEDFTDFINNHALFYVKQTSTTKEILSRVEEANHRLNLDVATAIEEWLEQQDDKEQTLLITGEGKQYNASELVNEIRIETKDGRKIEENILKLTIDLLFRKKEEI